MFFKKKADSFYMKEYYVFFRKKHVDVALDFGELILLFRPGSHGLCSIPYPKCDGLIEHIANNDLCIHVAVQKEEYKRSIFKLPTCVEIAKYIMGIRCGGITPAGLMEKLYKSKSQNFKAKFIGVKNASKK